MLLQALHMGSRINKFVPCQFQILQALQIHGKLPLRFLIFLGQKRQLQPVYRLAQTV